MDAVTSAGVAAPAPAAALLVDEATADQIGPGLVAFTIVVLLGIATFLLIRSMLYHIRKVPPSFDSESGNDTEDGQESSGSGVGKS